MCPLQTEEQTSKAQLDDCNPCRDDAHQAREGQPKDAAKVEAAFPGDDFRRVDESPD